MGGPLDEVGKKASLWKLNVILHQSHQDSYGYFLFYATYRGLKHHKGEGLRILTMLVVQTAISTIFTFFNHVERNLIQVVINRMCSV